ncbi:glycoside hydrolase family 172 protein [Amycolatopsis nigrescens]|uniref:glycoside hydrolase family 172 protein n=1 Tax=Amycolatopsis nigrescens TaxID=381445 RepID=UPI001FE0614C|nr:glycoside hydrolase family 172 protein [Amycolatopsis nigrescens]
MATNSVVPSRLSGRAGRGGAALVMAALACLTMTVAPAQAAPAAAPTVSKGPVGWDTYRSLNGLERLRPGEQVKQFSSFDRTGGNDDGFEGTYSCLRNRSDGRCVIADARGAGEISSLWFTYAANSVAAIGEITIELDGRTVLQGSLQDIVNGAKGAPFVWPLVGNSADTMGGTVIKVPMPYTSSMRITTQNNPHFYHVTYRQFADAAGVRTFDPTDKALDVVERLRGYGVRDPKPAAPGARTERTGVELPPGGAMSVPVGSGPGRISQLQLRLPQVVTAPAIYDDGRAFKPGSSSFSMAIDPANDGVRLTRRYDPKIAEQHSIVLVDGQQVGEWRTGAATPPDTWGDLTMDIPKSLTGGKSRIGITNRFVSSSFDINEFRYDVHSKVGGEWVHTDLLDVGPNHRNEEAAHGYQILGQRWEGLGVFRYPSDPARVAASDAVLEGLRLRVSFDGRTTVDSPVGEFFGSGLGKYAARNLMSGIDTTENGAFTSWWPMPFAEGAKVELVNGSTEPVQAGSLAITSAPDVTLPGDLAGDGTLGYFNATHQRGDTVPGKEWNFLTAEGKGVFYGVTTTMRGHIPPGGDHQMSYLEGDERVYADGSASPSLIGTGSEDFYESGWYFMDQEAGNREGVSYAMPQAGLVSHENAADGCQYVCLNAYRLMVADAVPFGSSLEFDIEHGPNSDRAANYSSTAYWYGQPSPSLAKTDTVDAADDASRALHGYSATGETRGTLTSTFEGRGDTTPVTGGTTSATGPVRFTAKVEQANGGLRLHRVSDQANGFQRANVFIDDRLVGEWYQPLTNGHSRWLEDGFDIPAALTGGKAAVQVRLEPVGGAPAWSGSRYTVFSQIGPGVDAAAGPGLD